jgi:hypothetical protein
MKSILLLSIFSLLISSCSTKKISIAQSITSFEVNGQLSFTLPYCKGIAPTPEDIKTLNTPIPYSTKLYLRNGMVNSESIPIIDSVTTDSDGKFTFEVLPGEYVILLPEQCHRGSIDEYLGKRKKFLAVDSLCLENWWENGLFQISVEDEDITKLNFNFRNKCFVPRSMPCATYTGPHIP